MGLTLGHLFRIVPQLIKLGSNGFGGRQFLVAIPLLGDQLAAHFGCRQSRVKTRGAKLGVGLALSIHGGREIAQQVGQMLFTALATTQAEAVDAGECVFHLLRPFADGLAIPAQLAFGQPLAAFA